MWFTSQSFRTRPIAREEFPEMLENFEGFPPLDVFICTADPYREPPGNVANMALSVLAYDYPTEKLSIYVSDDGGSELTLFALAEAARFAKHWLPFCRENGVVKRCPDAYFSSDNFVKNSQSHKIKMMYENMISRISNVVERGKVNKEYISKKDEHQAYTKYSSDKFSTNHHPSIIQVLLANNKDEDITDVFMPNLVYISRQKSKTYPHYFKAGALNVLLRVSRIMTNGPIILTLDCDMYSNDPSTPKRALCYFLDQTLWPNLAYVQTPQRFHGLNWADIYASEFRTIGRMNPLGMDGLCGPNHMGTGCFFRRRAFFGGPSSFVQPEIISGRVANKPIEAQTILEQAHQVASCNYENQTSWGYKMGFRYGSLVEDIHTGYHLHCEGWKSIFCNPKRPAFLGHVPLSLNDVVIQIKRWAMGLLEIAFSKYSPIIFGMWHLGPIMAQCYTHYAFWPIYAIPLTLYAFVPQLALLCGVPIFPKINAKDIRK
ncbi:Cellulose synthase-like protein G3 [Capsicum annuum]|nr:Cellulose synthase-like protein G3 [Capsicum annuum]KAF3652166.1 Cellulose synthase-like protein G3 [Capsicum annuum]